MAGFNFALLIPLAAIVFSMGLAMVAIMAEHQRKMTQLLQNSHNKSDEAVARMAAELQALTQRVQALQDQVHQQAIEQDSLEQRLQGRN